MMIARSIIGAFLLGSFPFSHGFTTGTVGANDRLRPTTSSTTSRISSPAAFSAVNSMIQQRHTKTTTTALNAFALDGALATVDGFFQTSPYLSAFLTCSVKASAADWVAQLRQQQQQDEEEQNINVNRNLAFIVYGGIYQGCIQSFLFGVLFPLWFPDPTSLHDILTQVAIDIFVLGPCACMPTVYSMKAVFAGEEPTQGLQKYWDHIHTKGILFKYWSIWGPVQTLNFGIVPHHLRVVFVAMVSFFWICLLSTVSSSADNTEEESASMVYPEQANSGIAANDPSSPLLLPIPVLSEAYERQQQLEAQQQRAARLQESQ